MKRIALSLMALAIAVPLAACGNTAQTPTPSNASQDSSLEAPAEEESDTPATEDVDENGYHIAYEFDGDPVDLLTIEEVDIMPSETIDGYPYYKWKVKCKNTSGADLPMGESSMRIWYRYLDADYTNLESIYLSGGYSSTVKDGRSEWIESNGYPASWDERTFNSWAYIEIFGYTTSLAGSPEYEFTNPILIDVHEMKAVSE